MQKMFQIVAVFLFTLFVLHLGRILFPYIWAHWARWRGRLPNGPRSYPIIGTLGIDEKKPWLTMTKWGEKYGKKGIFTYFLGTQLHVVITTSKIARHLLSDIRTAGRPDTNLKRLYQSQGLSFSEGPAWADLHRFQMRTLKDLDRELAIKNLMEIHVQQAAVDLAEDIRLVSATSNQFSVQEVLLKCVAYSIGSTVCGASLRADDPRFPRLAENLHEILFSNDVTPNSLLNVFPWLTYLPSFRRQQAALESRMDECVTIFSDILEEHRRNFDPDNIGDYMDVCLKEQGIRAAAGGDVGAMTDKNLLFMAFEIYTAGLDSVMAVLLWAMLLLSSTPDVQKCCQKEIDSKLGKSKMPIYSDRTSLPYCEAAINEVYRIGTIDPFGLPHRCLEDTPILEYTLPKDATILVNYYGIHMSGEVWKDPFQFQPERFLDVNGRYRPNPNNHPFAPGRRMCTGQNFSNRIMFISLVYLLQRFTFSRPENSKPWTEIGRMNGVGVYPETFNVTATAR